MRGFGHRRRSGRTGLRAYLRWRLGRPWRTHRRRAEPAWTGRPERIADGDTVLLPGQIPWRDLVHPGGHGPGGPAGGAARPGGRPGDPARPALTAPGVAAVAEPTQLLPIVPLLTPAAAWRSAQRPRVTPAAVWESAPRKRA